MMQFKEIVVGTDFSDASCKAIRQAAYLAGGEGGHVEVVHVMSATEVENFQRGFRVPTEEMLEVYRGHVRTLVDKHLDAASAAAVTVDAVVGAPYHELVKRADEDGCDLMVLGSRGAEVDETEVGFFAAKCVRHSKVPVLLARRDASGPFHKVVACVDFSETTDEVLDAALRVAADDGAKLDIVHAVRPPWEKATHVLYDLSTLEDDDFKNQYREVLAGEMAGAVKGIADARGVEVETHIIEHPSPEQALVDFLRESGADLAVVGRSGHTMKVLKHYLIGTTAERLIHRSPCSVLTVRDRG